MTAALLLCMPGFYGMINYFKNADQWNELKYLVHGTKQNVFGQCKLVLKMLNQMECMICLKEEKP